MGETECFCEVVLSCVVAVYNYDDLWWGGWVAHTYSIITILSSLRLCLYSSSGLPHQINRKARTSICWCFRYNFKLFSPTLHDREKLLVLLQIIGGHCCTREKEREIVTRHLRRFFHCLQEIIFVILGGWRERFVHGVPIRVYELNFSLSKKANKFNFKIYARKSFENCRFAAATTKETTNRYRRF